MSGPILEALINGGMGLEGIAQTPFYQFITSSEGLSELGVEATEPPKLLKAYRDTFRVDVRGTALSFYFGNVYNLIRATPHPASGTGQLKIGSWLRWAVDGQKVNDRGFVPRNRLPKVDKLRKRIRLGDPLGGLMLPANRFGSTGRWELPIVFRNYADEWFVKNKARLEELIVKYIEFIFASELMK